MHIITGILLNTLLHKRDKRGNTDKDSTSPLMKIKYPIAVEHVIPGRIRINAPMMREDVHTCDRVKKQLTELTSVKAVKVSPITGSVVISFDSNEINPSLLVAAMIRLLDLEKEMDRVPKARIHKELKGLANAFNRIIYEKTNGILDLWSASLIIFTLLGLNKLLTKGLFLPAGMTLMWWAGADLLRGKD